jgi:hypothetical protein
MTSRELSNSEQYFQHLPSKPLAERLAVFDYITKLFALLLKFAVKNFIVGGKFVKPSLFRIGVYITCVRIIIAIIKDIVAISKGELPGYAFRILE